MTLLTAEVGLKVYPINPKWFSTSASNCLLGTVENPNPLATALAWSSGEALAAALRHSFPLVVE